MASPGGRRKSVTQAPDMSGTGARRKSVIQAPSTPKRKLSRSERSSRRSRRPAEHLGDQSDDRPRSRIIFNEEIAQLRITEDSIPKSITLDFNTHQIIDTVKVAVRKELPENEISRPKIKYGVLHIAPPNASLRPPLDTGTSGPRYDSAGRLVPHSILGSAQEFFNMAVYKGDLQIEDVPEIYRPQRQENEEQMKSYLSWKSKQRHSFSSQCSDQGVPTWPIKHNLDTVPIKEESALTYWRHSMRERSDIMDRLADKTKQTPNQLLMAQSESRFLCMKSANRILDDVIPLQGSGKGFRKGSEFWSQVEYSRRTDIPLTLGRSQLGNSPSVEHCGIPETLKLEKGQTWHPSGNLPSPRHPWDIPFFKERSAPLKPLIREVNPHWPDCRKLEVIGKSISDKQVEELNESDGIGTDGTTSIEDNRLNSAQLQDPLLVEKVLVNGPSVIFGGKSVPSAKAVTQKDNKEDYCKACQENVENMFDKNKTKYLNHNRLFFEAEAKKRNTNYLEIFNNGTVVLKYFWLKIPNTKCFNIAIRDWKTFYFDIAPGIILPGQTIRLPITFKSNVPGLVSEQWEIQFFPEVFTHVQFLVTFRGAALQEDLNKERRKMIEEDLKHKNAVTIVKSILNYILDGLQEPEPEKKPIVKIKTEEDIFHELNPGLTYSLEGVKNLDQLYAEIRKNNPDYEPEYPEPTQVQEITIPSIQVVQHHPPSSESRHISIAVPSLPQLVLPTPSSSRRRRSKVEPEVEPPVVVDLPVQPEPIIIWDKSVMTIRKEIEDYPSDMYTARNEAYARMFSLVNDVSMTLYFPKTDSSQELYKLIYSCLIETTDDIFSSFEDIRKQLNLPDIHKAENEDVTSTTVIEDSLAVPTKGRAGRRPSKGRKSAEPPRRSVSRSGRTSPGGPGNEVLLDLASAPETTSNLSKCEEMELWKVFKERAHDSAYVCMLQFARKIQPLLETVPSESNVWQCHDKTIDSMSVQQQIN